ncbi:MAG: ATP-binding cassette domain-containing protein [Clostridiales bacterium]|jgi:energy-coupling factor transporter ATP-binding protein EcfA2|nr:ATP-binding cassette domain-containing protein [Clostridiales bacterium]
MDILQIEGLSFSYPGAAQRAVDNFSLTVDSGEFLVLCGESGCGKTTLLRLLKRELAPAGERSGRILYDGVPQEELEARVSAHEIGYVQQNPDSQIVTDKVWHELAFGLENLGVPTASIRRRVGEMASYFGIQDWFRRDTDELSGGQKQLLNLASVMVMQPRVLILDEPTSQLDPIAAADFIATLHKLNRELGLTILLVEHRLEEVFPLADRVVLMERGRLLLCDTPRAVGERLRGRDIEHPMLAGLPSAVRIYQALTAKGECPLTVKEGRQFLSAHYRPAKPEPPAAPLPAGTPAVELREVWFRYERDLPDVLRGVNLRVYPGEIFCLLGGNGTGKTTTLNVAAGLDRAYRGKVLIEGRPIREYKGNTLYRHLLAALPQNPQSVFLKNSVEEDLEEIPGAMGLPPHERKTRVADMAERLCIAPLLNQHPYDLSGGEQQKCALAKMLLLQPRILLLDEPTKGLDAGFKRQLGGLLEELKRDGAAILMVTHDVEFAAETADRCALFFDGEVLSAAPPPLFFADNTFYTTAASRMARHLYPYAVTCAGVAEECRKGGMIDD